MEKVQLRRPRRETDSSKLPVNYQLRNLLPFVFMVQDAMDKSPNDLVEIFKAMLNPRPHREMRDKDLSTLRKYLKKWGLQDFTREQE